MKLLLFLTTLFIVSGTVVNQKTGERLKNANVCETNSNIGTITDSNGQFKLFLTKKEANILISNDDFEIFSIDLKLKNDTCINVKLKPFEIKKKILFR